MKRAYRINRQITASKVRLVDSTGKQLGILSIEEAIKKAESPGLDLIEVAPNATPPVVKMVDFKKFSYKKRQEQRRLRKKHKEVEIKEIRLGPLVSDHDLQVKLKHAQQFFSKGELVKFTIRFSGRQMAHPELGDKLIDKLCANLVKFAKIVREKKFEGRNLSIIFAPIK